METNTEEFAEEFRQSVTVSAGQLMRREPQRHGGEEGKRAVRLSRALSLSSEQIESLEQRRWSAAGQETPRARRENVFPFYLIFFRISNTWRIKKKKL